MRPTDETIVNGPCPIAHEEKGHHISRNAVIPPRLGDDDRRRWIGWESFRTIDHNLTLSTRKPRLRIAFSAPYQKLPQSLKPADDFGNIRHALLNYFLFSGRSLSIQLLRIFPKLDQNAINSATTLPF
jgi:hypothetical protein